ncbi:hypothetical protein BU23DRAFT_553562 [Bimuria novae-zelandiae CBS 107.79]|uniref:Uncharacterized protein n=1 Tax=Bimuria novae-zelandiae CBS 107.79 TaxID=1447943 RepID=A0A6A5VAL7_9PLEO|nr:hypothetical protein BU23DRAFT_553562 [Bimuria novae-zelandiae CBS 107.79]
MLMSKRSSRRGRQQQPIPSPRLPVPSSYPPSLEHSAGHIQWLFDLIDTNRDEKTALGPLYRNCSRNTYISLNHRSAALETERANLERKLDFLLKTHALTACRAFADAFFTNIPREIHDMVYAHAIETDNSIPLHRPWAWGCADPRTKAQNNGEPEDCHCFYWDSINPWLNPFYVGDAVAAEVATHYYANMYFVLNCKSLRKTTSRLSCSKTISTAA